MAAFDVRPAEPDRPVATLSGGNPQRVVRARELARRPALLIAAYPTHGLDVGAVAFVHETLRRLRAEGTAILLVSADRDELFGLADRVAVMYRGTFAYESTIAAVDARAFGRAMVGFVQDDEPAPELAR
jgi:simple sugar transport system ATP-binding protein